MNENVSVAPASVTKAITALYAFAIFSDDKKYVRGFQRRIVKHLRGAKIYNTRSKKLQWKLIGRWGAVHNS